MPGAWLSTPTFGPLIKRVSETSLQDRDLIIVEPCLRLLAPQPGGSEATLQAASLVVKVSVNSRTEPKTVLDELHAVRVAGRG